MIHTPFIWYTVKSGKYNKAQNTTTVCENLFKGHLTHKKDQLRAIFIFKVFFIFEFVLIFEDAFIFEAVSITPLQW